MPDDWIRCGPRCWPPTARAPPARQVGHLRRVCVFRFTRQQEIDHLDGLLTQDRATPQERRRPIAVLLEHERPAARAA